MSVISAPTGLDDAPWRRIGAPSSMRHTVFVLSQPNGTVVGGRVRLREHRRRHRASAAP